MEAPEKIYIIIDPVWGSMCVNYDKNDTNNIEYVRKDAVIEKFEEWIKNKYSETDYRFKEDFTGMLINDFKNYIKEK